MSIASASTGHPVTPADHDPADIEVTVVMPCLNESDTLATCIEKARTTLADAGISGEIVVADNGSSDDSASIAHRLGARVVEVAERGYGHALMHGIASANGRFVIMGDADDSYDFEEIGVIVSQLRAGADLVMGCRLPRGGGRVLPGAMPWLHHWWGNPMFSFLARRMFGSVINDVYCGLRGFTRRMYLSLDLRCTGMEFAVEMLIKSTLFGYDVREVPITLRPDGRRHHPPHLRTFRDGWRTLRFFLLYSPRWLFLVPGGLLILAGLLGYALAMPGTVVFGARLDVHTLLFASVAILLGYQTVQFAAFTSVFAVTEGLLPATPRFMGLFRLITLERGLVLGVVGFVAGSGLLGAAITEWWRANWGDLEYSRVMRLVIPGVTLVALGFQTILSSFFVSVLGLARK